MIPYQENIYKFFQYHNLNPQYALEWSIWTLLTQYIAKTYMYGGLNERSSLDCSYWTIGEGNLLFETNLT